jgi:hypothetical protein
MRLYHSNNQIVDVVSDRNLIAYEAPSQTYIEVQEVTENKALCATLLLHWQETINDQPRFFISNGVLTELPNTAVVIFSDPDRSQLKTEYQNTIDTLVNIENAVNPTNAQVIAGVKFLAKTLRLLLKLLARQYS